MQQRKKSNSVITHELVGNDVIRFSVVGAGTFDFNLRNYCGVLEISDGSDLAPMKVDLWDKLPDEVQLAIIHGIVQKISDRAAIGRDPDTGTTATPEEKFDAMKECAERLSNGGPWNAVSAGTGSAGGVLYHAMRRLYPNAWGNRKAFGEFLERKAGEESVRLKKTVSVTMVRNGLLAVKKIAEMVETIRAESGQAAGVDVTEILSEIE